VLRLIQLLLLLFPLITIAQQQSVNVDGRQIYYDVAGSGSPVLVFHGWTETGADWKPLLKELEDRYQLVYVDLPGHGRSGIIDKNFSVQKSALEMQKFLSLLQLDGARVIAFSYGGMLVLEMLAANPRQFREAVLISTPYKFNGADMEPVALDSLPLEYQQLLFKKHKDGEPQVRELFNSSIDYRIDLTEADVTPIFIPVMIIQGDKDTVTPTEQARTLSGWLPSSQLWLIKGKGHKVIDARNSTDFQQRLRSFFAEF
jgi:pimeloyl-ACP methyl ester carboxylesterase